MQDHRRRPAVLDRPSQGRSLARARPAARPARRAAAGRTRCGKRRDRPGSLGRGVAEEVAHRAVCSPRCRRRRGLRHADPPGRRAVRLRAISQHRRAARAAEGPHEWVHRRAPSRSCTSRPELWLKLATSDVEEAARLTDERTSPRQRASCAARSAACAPDRPAGHAGGAVAVGVPGDPQGARSRERLRLARAAVAPCSRCSGRRSTRDGVMPASHWPSSTCSDATTTRCIGSPSP